MAETLESVNPSLAREWHPTLNDTLSPADVAPKSHKIVWWLGKCGHHWDSSVDKRAAGEGCPICRNLRIVEGVNDLATVRPSLAAEWNFERNKHLTLRNGNPISPQNVGVGYAKKIWWLGECGHEWETSVASRALGRGCRYCKGGDVLEGFNDLATLRPDIASSWDHKANGELTPTKIRSGSSKKVFWLCPFGHSFPASVQGRASGRGCGVCRNLDIRPGVNDLATLRPDIAVEWDHQKNLGLSTLRKTVLNPQTVSPESNIKVWWLCPLGHSYDSLIKNRCSRGLGCRICSGAELLIGFNDLATRHPDLAKEFHPTKNGSATPSQIHGGQPIDYWWLGKCGHEWVARLSNRASRDSGCPECALGGYKSTQPGLIYFISNDARGAFKIGITNPGAKNDRLKGFRKDGWKVITTINDSDGRLILNLETLLLHWIRKELKLPAHLDKTSVGAMNGASETFGSDLVSKEAIVQKLESEYNSLKSASKA